MSAQVTVTIDSNIKYQTIVGWGHGGSIFAGCSGFWVLPDTTYSDSLSKQYIDYAIDILGLTGSRNWEIGPRVDGTGMDNGDCDSIDWSKFQSNSYFPWYYKYVKYFSDRIKALGYQPSFYSSPTYPTFATAFKPWVLNHPGERAQQIWANAMFWKNNYDVDINYAVIYNEPSNPVTSTILADDIKALGPRLIARGLNTKVQYAEAVTPQTNWDYIIPVQNDSELWHYIGRISYHNYGNYNSPDPYRPLMRDYADSLGITTAQTEMGEPSFDNLYSDLTLGGVSYWEVGYSSSSSIPVKSGQTQFSYAAKFFRLRQLLHYVRPGDVRISAETNDTNLHVLAFNHKGKTIAIIENISNQKTVTISGLTPGIYNVSYSKGDPSAEIGLKNAGADGKITLDVKGESGATTLYPYSGVNQPPAILNWGSDKGYLMGSESTLNLTVIANDVELDNLTYHWTINTQPVGANVLINNPNNASSQVSGLTESGFYIFKIDVSDGNNISSEKVYLFKYDSKPPAMIGQAGFRFAPPYGLVFSGPNDTTHANVELPASSAILQVGVGDLTGSNFSGRGKWSLVSAPPNAPVKVDSTIWIYVSIRAQVTGMTVPGDYVFRVVVTDPPYPDKTTIIKCTVHPASSAPVISKITVIPDSLFLPQNSTLLTGEISDPEGDLMRNWWVVKSAPEGAKPVFDHQGLPVTNVSGLTIPGNYTFTLRTFDDLHITTKDISIEVKNKPVSIEENAAKNLEISIFPNPVNSSAEIIISSNEFVNANIQIINSLGIVVKDFGIVSIGGNTKNIDWDGTDRNGVTITQGIYFIKLSGNSCVYCEKFILMR